MKNVASVFTASELAFIAQYGNVVLTNEQDYSVDDLLDIHETICDNTPSYVDSTFECIIDKFYDNFEI